MKNIKAPAVEPKLPARKPKAKKEVIVLREKMMRPMNVLATIRETKAGGWKITYGIGKGEAKLDHSFSSIEAAFSFLNAVGKFKMFNKKGIEYII
jgi:hypothetical protein